jgi:hypothetical protein
VTLHDEEIQALTSLAILAITHDQAPGEVFRATCLHDQSPSGVAHIAYSFICGEMAGVGWVADKAAIPHFTNYEEAKTAAIAALTPTQPAE